MCVWNRKWKSNKLFYRCQWLFRSPLRFFTSFYWSYRISRDLCDWIKYTLLQRKRRRRWADVLWIRFCGVCIFMNVWKWNQQMAADFVCVFFCSWKRANISSGFQDWNIFLFPFACILFLFLTLKSNFLQFDNSKNRRLWKHLFLFLVHFLFPTTFSTSSSFSPLFDAIKVRIDCINPTNYIFYTKFNFCSIKSVGVFSLS